MSGSSMVIVDTGKLPDSINCPDCGGDAVYQRVNEVAWKCQDCAVVLPLQEAIRQLKSDDTVGEEVCNDG